MTVASGSQEIIVIEPVRFSAEEAVLTGNLYLPADAREGVELPGIVVTGTWTSVKEQMANRYAQRLAERGLAALSFDFTGFGLSGGEPREVESPSLKEGDIRSAVSFLHRHPAIDGDRIGALAICASAGYAANAAIRSRRLRALTLVAPWLHDAKLLREVYGGEDGVRARLAAGEAARERYVETGVVDYVPVADANDQRAAMPMKIDFYDDPARGAVPGWPNRFAVMAWTEWLAFDAIALAREVTAPTLIVHSEEAAIPDGARRFYEALTCAKEIVWTDGTQFDFYDQDPQVSFAIEQAVAHFERHL
jgi:fermentation-respiration switch protein FrsA (DUF1100 family)